MVIGFYVVQWDTSTALGTGAGVPIKFVTIVVASFVITAILYEVVKRTNVTRFLFGMRPLK